MNRRGAVGTWALIIIGAFAAVGIWFFFFREAPGRALTTAPDAEESTTSAEAARAQTRASRIDAVRLPEPPPLSSLVRVDTRLTKNAGGVYMRAQGGAGGGSYLEFSIASPMSLVRVYPKAASKAPDGSPASSAASSASTIAADAAPIYADAEHVYVLETTQTASASAESTAQNTDTAAPTETAALIVLDPADPATFQLLANDYAKDAEHVYILKSVCDEHGTCVQELQIVEGADPATFDAFDPTAVQKSDGSGIIVIDSMDDESSYYTGVAVDVSPRKSGTGSIQGVQDENGFILLAP